jgi:hypothetical protein
MLKFDMKKYLSYDVLRKVMMFCLVTLLCACSEEEGMGEGKETNYASQSSCWQTKILDATLKIVDNLFSTSAGKVASGGAAIVMIAFSIWVAFKLLKVLASFKEENVFFERRNARCPIRSAWTLGPYPAGVSLRMFGMAASFDPQKRHIPMVFLRTVCRTALPLQAIGACSTRMTI